MGADGKSVYLHVGGQATGAEDLVVYMAANRAGLRRAGLGLHCFDPMGSGAESLAPHMPDPDADDAALTRSADGLAVKFGPDRRAGSDGFVVSASDLAGPMAELLLGRFHPNAGKRAQALRQALGQGVDRMVLTVQPYEVMFHSVWMALALDRLIDPFQDYAQALARFRGGWADMATTLVDALEVRELVIVAAPISTPQLLAHVVPGLALRQPVQPLPKPRITSSAVAMAQRCIVQGTRLQPGQRDRLVAFHARQPQVRPDLGFSALELSDLRGRYVADLDTLAQMPQVTMVGDMVPAMAAE